MEATPGTPVASTAQDSKVDWFAGRVAAVDWVGLLLTLLGALLLNQFIAQIESGGYRGSGFRPTPESWADEANIPTWASDFLSGGVAANADWFGPLFGAAMLIGGVMLIVGIARHIVGLGVAAVFWVFWYLSSATDGIWTFEYLFPALFGTLAAVAAIPAYSRARTLRDRLLGPRYFGSTNPVLLGVLAAAFVALLGWFFDLSRSGGESNDFALVASLSGAAIFLLLLAAIAIDARLRTPRAAGDHPLERVRWVDIMVISIGAMLAIQVFADNAVGWYTAEGYRGLVDSYADSSSAPGWWRDFLSWSGTQADWLWVTQAIAEFACAAFLVTLLFRPAALAATLGFFATLMFSEFGVSATIKIGSDLTWTWEMIYLTTATALLMFATLPATLARRRSALGLFLGPAFYSPRWGLGARLAIAAAGAVVVYCVGSQTKMFGSEFASTSFRGALYTFILLIALGVIDLYRSRLDSEVSSPRR